MEALTFITICVLALIFACVVAVLVLRFTAVLQQMQRTMTQERHEYARQVDESNVHAFNNAMTALEAIQTRISDNQVTMFNRTMDMVHGPQRTDDQQEFAADAPQAENRPAWIDDDGLESKWLYVDPTDLTDPTPPIEPTGEEANGHRAISVRPGEGLIPNG